MIPYFEQAYRTIVDNAMRSFLTITGLVIGVGAVVMIQVIGTGMAGAVNLVLGNVSSDVFVVEVNATQPHYDRALITAADLGELTQLPNVAMAIPLPAKNAVVRHGHAHGRYTLSSDAAVPFDNAPLAAGRRFTQAEIDGAADVAVISHDVAVRLFGTDDPVGQNVYEGARRFLVIGVLAPARAGIVPIVFGQDISVPYTRMVRQYARQARFTAVRFDVRSESDMKQTETDVMDRLRALHADKRLEYSSADKAQFNNGVNGVFAAITAVVGLIGAVSLLVAGIGIMNIMLVSVTERTREIGLRVALGARSAAILRQFLIEAVVLSTGGGAIGVVLGVAGAASIALFAHWPATVPLTAVLLALAFSAAVGVFFGYWPARKAAALDPIRALRFE